MEINFEAKFVKSLPSNHISRCVAIHSISLWCNMFGWISMRLQVYSIFLSSRITITLISLVETEVSLVKTGVYFEVEVDLFFNSILGRIILELVVSELSFEEVPLNISVALTILVVVWFCACLDLLHLVSVSADT